MQNVYTFTDVIKNKKSSKIMSRSLSESEKVQMDKLCTEIQVTPIDSEKLAKTIGDLLVKQLEHLKGKEFRIESLALSSNRKWLLDTECCAQKGDFSISIRRKSEEKKNEDGSTTTQMFPFAIWDFDATVEQLEDYLLKPVDLKTFMGQRYCYNPRIISNMKGLIPELK